MEFNSISIEMQNVYKNHKATAEDISIETKYTSSQVNELEHDFVPNMSNLKNFDNKDVLKSLLVKIIKQMNSNIELQYSVHEKTKQVMVKVIDSETKEVIRQIPEEKALDTFAGMLELAGISFDKKI